MKWAEIKFLHSLLVLKTHLPEVKHVEEDRNLHQIDSAADVVVSQHHQVATQLQTWFLYQVRLPVTLEYLE